METELRKVIRDLIDPMIEWNHRTKERFANFEKQLNSVDERLILIEEIVIQKGEGSTIFDQIKDNFLNIESQRLQDNKKTTDYLTVFENSLNHQKAEHKILVDAVDRLS